MRHKGDIFVLDWYHVFGWEEDPFRDIILVPSNYFTVGYESEREKINSFIIKDKKLGSISGERGTGKTTILKWLDFELNKYKSRIISFYIDCKQLHSDKDLLKKIIGPLLDLNEKLINSFYTGLDIPLVLKGLGNHEPKFLERFFSKPYLKLDSEEIIGFIESKLKGKRLTLLLDDVKYLSKNDINLIEKLINSNLNLQIIPSGTGEEIKKTGLTTTFKDELKVELKHLSYENSKELIKKRITFFGGSEIIPFEDKSLRDIYNESATPRELLKNCYDFSVKKALKKLREEQREPIEIKPEPKQVERNTKGEKEEPPKIKSENESKKEYEVKTLQKDKKEYIINVVEQKDNPNYKIKKVKR